MPERQALVVSIIAAGGNITITRLAKEFPHRLALRPAVFQQHHAAGSQIAAAFADDMRQIGQTAISGDKRRFRLKAHIALRQMRVGFIDVGRIADDDVKLLPGERAKPVALQYADVRNSEMFNVTRGQRDRIGHHVDGGDAAVRAFAGQRQGDRAGAGAEIENAARLIG